MTGRYTHAPTCPLSGSWFIAGSDSCNCGATAQQSAFEAGKREGLEEAAKVAETNGVHQPEQGDAGKAWNAACRDTADRIRALKDTNG
jgi:hypothetical protein